MGLAEAMVELAEPMMELTEAIIELAEAGSAWSLHNKLV